jgi:hypothetical protein
VSTEEQRTVMSRTEVLYWIGLDLELDLHLITVSRAYTSVSMG